jgi:hypothetical protein
LGWGTGRKGAPNSSIFRDGNGLDPWKLCRASPFSTGFCLSIRHSLRGTSFEAKIVPVDAQEISLERRSLTSTSQSFSIDLILISAFPSNPHRPSPRRTIHHLVWGKEKKEMFQTSRLLCGAAELTSAAHPTFAQTRTTPTSNHTKLAPPKYHFQPHRRFCGASACCKSLDLC